MHGLFIIDLLEAGMPIYEYLCNSCGVKNEHMQKMSDAPIEACPKCGSDNYNKQISAVGFQLKGSGWYETDFKNKPPQPAAKTKKNNKESKSVDKQTNTSKKTTTETKSASKTSKNTDSGKSTSTAD